MRLVVADTSPLRYLVQIDQVDLLPQLFEKIFIPSVVCDELRHPSAPQVVRTWMRSVPEWLEISVVRASGDPSLDALDEGEKSAITLGCRSRPTSCFSTIGEALQQLGQRDLK